MHVYPHLQAVSVASPVLSQHQQPVAVPHPLPRATAPSERLFCHRQVANVPLDTAVLDGLSSPSQFKSNSDISSTQLTLDSPGQQPKSPSPCQGVCRAERRGRKKSSTTADCWRRVGHSFPKGFPGARDNFSKAHCRRRDDFRGLSISKVMSRYRTTFIEP